MQLVQEYAHVLRRRGLSGRRVREQARDLSGLAGLHEVAEADLQLGLNLVATHPAPGIRDGVRAATALQRGIPVVVTTDRGFDGIAGLERVDPHDAPARLAGPGRD